MDSKGDDKLLQEARERLSICIQIDKDVRLEAKEDMRFVLGDQWPKAVKQAWDEAARPALTINKLPRFIQILCNEQRKSRPQIQFSAQNAGEVATEVAEVLEGMARQIQKASNAEIAYDTAFQNMASCSMGAFRINTKWADDDKTFDQIVTVEPIMDAMSVFFDPNAKEYDRSDSMFAFVSDWFTRSSLKETYGDELADGGGDDSFSGFDSTDWFEPGPTLEGHDDRIRVVEYWTVEVEQKPLYYWSDGTVSREKPTGSITIERERKTQTRTVMQRLLTATKVLRTTKWLGRWIPIIPVYGHETVFEGKRSIWSLVRFMRDPSQILNYLRSKEVEAVALAPLAPFIGYLGQFATKMQEWQVANKQPVAFLEVDPITVDGKLAPLPQRSNPDVNMQGILMLNEQVAQDLMQTAGSTESNQGSLEGRDQSGKTTALLQAVGDITNYHYIDNLARSMWHGGRVMEELIRKVYSAPRQIKTLGMDAKEAVMRVNDWWKGPDGILKRYMLADAQCDTVVYVGPAYATQVREISDKLDLLVQLDPAIFAQIADIWVQVHDIPEPWKSMLADRLKPPQVAQAEALKGKITPQMAAQLMQQNQQLTQLLQKAHQIIEMKATEGASREKIASINAATQVYREKMETARAALKSASEHNRAELQAKVDAIESELQRLHEEKAAVTKHFTGAMDREHQHSLDKEMASHEADLAPEPTTTGAK